MKKFALPIEIPAVFGLNAGRCGRNQPRARGSRRHSQDRGTAGG